MKFCHLQDPYFVSAAVNPHVALEIRHEND